MDSYDIVVIGGGGAGFVSAKLTHGLGKKVAVVERERLGGDCTWHGCIPSKALIKAAHVAHNAANISHYGLEGEVSVKAKRVMSHVRSVIEGVAGHEQPEDLTKEGIGFYQGAAEFVDRHTISVGGQMIKASKFIICTGSSAFVPPIEGINDLPYLTNKNIFTLEELPESMIVLGGGPIGLELSQALSRLGVKVTIVEMMESLLIREERELTDLLTARLREEGIDVLTGTKAVKVRSEGGRLYLALKGGPHPEISAERLLVAVGRLPNVEGLKLENAGVKYTGRGIETDLTMRTSAPNIYACGDVVGPYRFSHMAEYQAVVAGTNAVLPFKRKANYNNVPWATFTDPELARVGMTEAEARNKYGDKVRVYRHEYKSLDRAITEVERVGLAKFVTLKSGKILGAHILGAHAGDIIHEAQILRTMGRKLYEIQQVIHAYPTYADITRQAGKRAYIDHIRDNFFVKLISAMRKKK